MLELVDLGVWVCHKSEILCNLAFWVDFPCLGGFSGFTGFLFGFNFACGWYLVCLLFWYLEFDVCKLCF